MRNKWSRRAIDSYEEDIAGDDENGMTTVLPPPAPVTRTDVAIAGALGVVSALFAYFASYKGMLHPAAWQDCVVAAGLREPTAILPGLWRIGARLIYWMFGVAHAGQILAVMGKVALGVVAALSYLSFRALAALVVRKLPKTGVWETRLARLVSAVAAFSLVCSDPVWSVFQSFSSSAFLVFLFALSTTFWMRFYHGGKLTALYWAMFLTGLMTAESPIGILMLVFFWSVYFILLDGGYLVQVELVNLFVSQNSKWSLTICGAAGLVLGVSANVIGYAALGGLSANGVSFSDVPLEYIVRYWGLISGSASAGGWIIGAGMSFMPFVLSLALVHRATDVEYFLKYQVGLVFFAVACIAYSQLASLHPLWFWTWIKTPAMVTSPLLLAVMSFMSSVALLCALAVFVVDAYCRNNKRLAQQVDPDSVEDDGGGRKRRAFRAFVLMSFVAALVAGLVPARIQPRAARMLDIVRDCVRETVDEAGDAKWLFTDGALDCGLELEAASRNRRLTCISLVNRPTARSVRSVSTGLPDAEDRFSARAGGANLLRTWQRDKPARIADSAFQLGFELWRRSGLAYPPVAGLVARVEGKMTPEEVASGAARAHALAEQVLSLYSVGGPVLVAGPVVNDLFVCVQWRLARIAKIRSEIYDFAGDPESAISEMSLADALDDRNESLRDILTGMTKLREQAMRQMTPRQGLQFALVRADFGLARRYAEPILDADPDDLDANFGMAWSYIQERQLARAEEYFTRYIRRNDKQPAVWNNLAMIQLETGRLDEALASAKKALALIPESAEVKDTVSRIEKAIEDAKAKGQDEKKGDDAKQGGAKAGEPGQEGE